MRIEQRKRKYTYRAEVLAKIDERRKMRGMAASQRQRRSRTERMPEETAQEYIEHYERHGIEHFKPEHCPAKFRAAVVANFGRAA